MTTFQSVYTNKTAKMPIFDFMIPEEGFYVSTPGFSVTKLDKSYSALADGKFYIMNKNNITIYFNKLVVARAQFRNISRTNNLTISLYETTSDTDYVYDTYYIYYKKTQTSVAETNGNIIGQLILRTNVNHLNGNNVRLFPFESLEFAASYEVLNLNNLAVQYYGKTNTNPDLLKGTIDIVLDVYCFANKDFTVSIRDNIIISINLINTGYIPVSIQPATESKITSDPAISEDEMSGMVTTDLFEL